MAIRLTIEGVPEPPAGAARWDGDPPYFDGGYVIDFGNRRWRYRSGRLVGFIEYAAGRQEWLRTWFDGRGY